MSRILGKDNDDYSYSNIVKLVQEDKEKLKKLVLDLSDLTFNEVEELKRLEKLVVEQKRKVEHINKGLAVCIEYGNRNFDYGKRQMYSHDKEDKTVEVTYDKTATSINVKERYFSFK